MSIPFDTKTWNEPCLPSKCTYTEEKKKSEAGKCPMKSPHEDKTALVHHLSLFFYYNLLNSFSLSLSHPLSLPLPHSLSLPIPQSLILPLPHLHSLSLLILSLVLYNHIYYISLYSSVKSHLFLSPSYIVFTHNFHQHS